MFGNLIDASLGIIISQMNISVDGIIIMGFQLIIQEIVWNEISHVSHLKFCEIFSVLCRKLVLAAR